ncbi:MAG: DUF523 domain-containing protein [Candidatus Omnitrophica bacterium]|nr:DUF523 domain-containing protein [Candidatus Omnitrophota bacterium]
MAKILVSACLTGNPCAYDGRGRLNERVAEICSEHGYIPFCPEMDGGLPSPREPNEIINGTGKDVLSGKARVRTSSGADNTAKFLEGARIALGKARRNNIEMAILKSRSPSCGCRRIYDGTFSRTLTEGMGVAAAILERSGIHVISEEEI